MEAHKRFLKKIGCIILGALVIFNIIDANSSVTKTEEVKETVNFSTETVYDKNMRENTTTIKQEGRNGSKTVTYSIMYKYGKETKRVKLSESIIEPSQNKIVVKGTKKVYICSDGTEHDTVNEKNECENKILWTKQRDASLQKCYADSNKFNCWYDEYPGTTLHWDYYTYVNPGNSGSSGSRTGAICRDGWRSTATGRGACSHHGGVSYWLY